MAEHVIPPANWMMKLADAIRDAADGDTIVVQTDAKKQVAESGIVRQRPNAGLIVVVRPAASPFSE